MKRLFITLIGLLSLASLLAQTEGVSINTDGTDPHPSAMLDVQSSDKGLLIPRMDSSSRKAIVNPAEGLMVYDSTTQSFWYYQQVWQELGEAASPGIRDADGDTYVDVEATPDEDVIRLGVEGKQTVAIDNAGAYLETNLFAGRSFAASSSLTVNYTDIAGFQVLGSSSPGWQSFRASTGGKLDFIQLKFSQNASPNYTISLYEGEGTSGKLLSTTNLSSPNSGFWISIPFPDEITLDKAMTYTIGFSSINRIGYEAGDLYPEGKSSISPSIDFLLRVHLFEDLYKIRVGDGTVGIGTSSPDTTLHVVGKFKYQDGSEQNGYVLTSDADGVATWQPTAGDDMGNHLASQNLALGSNYLSGDGDNEGLSVSGDGQVGIGTIDPQASLHVATGVDASLTGNGYLLLGNVNSSNIIFDDNEIMARNNGSTTGIFLQPEGGDVLMCRDGGAVGIGTASPDTSLHVVGKVKYQDGSEQNGYVLTSDANGVATWQAPTINSTIRDTDQDTYIGVEESPDDDIIRLGVDGKEAVIIDSTETRLKRNLLVASSFQGSSTLSLAVDPNFGGNNFLATASSSPNWQSFRPTVGGKLDFIQLPFASSPGPNYTFTLYKGEGTSGDILSTTNISSPNPLSFNQISFPDEVILAKGGTYTIGFSSMRDIGFRFGNVYPEGNNGGNGIGPDADFLLRVHMFEESFAFNVVGENVGIGTSNPTRGRLEINGVASPSPIGSHGYLNINGANTNSSANNSYSIYASGAIAASDYNAFSDRRIKNIRGISDSESDLRILMQIEVTDYRLRDSIAKGNKAIKKVIAQQVAEVYPQAVSNDLTEVVPDIYQRADMQDGWIMLATDLQVGERVKLITAQSAEVHDVIAVEADRFRIAQRSPFNSERSTVFVYGREVTDFHTVDYEALSMLNVSATQEQQRQIESQEARIEALEKENATLRTEMQAFSQLKTEQVRLAKELAEVKAHLNVQP